MDRVHIYTYTDIRGPRKRTGCYIYLLEQETEKGPATLHKIEKVEEPETENRVQLLAVIGALRRLRKNCELVIHTHSEYVAAGIENGWIWKWAGNGWKTEKGDPVANRPEWEEIAELLNAHEFEFHTGRHAYSVWMESEIERQKPKEAEREFRQLYEKLRKKYNLEMHSKSSIYERVDDLIEIWRYEGEKIVETVSRVKEKDIEDCYRRAAADLIWYDKRKSEEKARTLA